MDKIQKIKIAPKGNVTLDLIKVDNIQYDLKGKDEDGDIFSLGVIKVYEDKLDEDSFSSQSDLKIFNTFRKTKGKKRIFLDVIKVSDLFRHQGLGEYMIEELCKKMKSSGYEAICLKAYPLVTWRYGIQPNKDKAQIKKEKSIIQKFYLNNGFNFCKKGVDYMYKEL